MAPVDLDSFTQEELKKFIDDYEKDAHQLALELFPSKDFAFVTVTKHLYEYSKNKLQAINNRLNGKIDTALHFEKLCDDIYQQLQDYAKW